MNLRKPEKKFSIQDMKIWVLAYILAGYPVEFAMKNYNDLFRYIETHEINKRH